MACEDTLLAIQNNTASTNSKLDTANALLTQIRDGLTGVGGGSSEDYLHDMTVLLASLHQNVLGSLPDGLITVSSV